MVRHLTCVGVTLVLVGSPCLVAVPAALAQQPEQVAFASRPESSIVKQRGDGSPLQRRVSVTFAGVALSDAIDEIARKAQLDLSYQTHMLEQAKPVTATFTDVSAEAALMTLLSPYGLHVNETSTGHYIVVKTAAHAKQEVGSVEGRVTEDKTGNPIENAQVIVVGTSIKALTDDKGHYVLHGVPAGKVTVSVRALGFQAKKIVVTVTANGTVTAGFALTRQATVLADVVSTATGEQRRLEVANAVARLNVDSLVENTPIRSITDLIASRIPGVEVTRSNGTPGAPARIRIRGISSAVVSNDPVVIVDGVRIASSGSSSDITTKIGAVGMTVASRLDDIDPESVASIEVLRGPSAATLYGTDAANGVIVIKTKRGTPGTTRWGAKVTHDWSSVPAQYPLIYRGFGHTPVTSASTACTLQLMGAGYCIMDSVSTFNPLNSPFTTNLGHGSNTQASLDVSGGSQQVQYYITASHTDNPGAQRLPEADVYRLHAVGMDVPESVKQPQRLRQTSLTSKLTMQPHESLDMSVTVDGFQQGQQNNTSFTSTNTGDAQDTVTYLPMRYFQNLDNRKVSRGVLALDGDWRPVGWLTTHGTLGIDHASVTENAFNPQYDCTVASGCVLNRSVSNVGYYTQSQDVYTAQFNSTLTRRLNEAFVSRLTFGGEFHRSNLAGLSTVGGNLAPGSISISTAQNKLITPSQSAEATAGWSLNEDLGFRDRLFLSLGFRQDAGSAFGSDIHAPVYPKLGLSWLISSEPFFPSLPFVDQLRVRVAYGHSGVQPPAGAATGTYRNTPLAIVNGSVVNTIDYATVGNSLLNPERSIETEGGFDADLFGSRVNVEFTAYNKSKRNFLIARDLGPSVPVTAPTQYQNIGNLVNRGVETSVSAKLLDHDGWMWVATVGASMNRNKVVSLGPATPSGDSASRIIAGYPIDSRWIHPVLGFKDVNGNGVVDQGEVIFGDTLVYIGTTQPRYSISYSTTFTLPAGLSLDANLGYDAGFTQIQTPYDGRGMYDPNASFAEQAIAYIAYIQGNWQTVSVLRLNSMSLNYHLPVRLARNVGARNATISFSGSNLGMWTKYRGADPSVNSTPVGDKLTDNGSAFPLTRNWSMGLRLEF